MSKDFEAICGLFDCLRRPSGCSLRVIYWCGLQLRAHPREPTEGITTPPFNWGQSAATSNELVKKQRIWSWRLLCLLPPAPSCIMPLLLQRFISSGAHRQYIAFTASLWRNSWEFMGAGGEGFLHGRGVGNSCRQTGSSWKAWKEQSKWVSDLEKYLA